MAIAKPLPSVKFLRKLFRYEPETGKLYWLPRTPDMFKDAKRSKEHACAMWNANNANKEAGSKKRHIDVKINSEFYKAHRIIWAIYYGETPEKTPDHINGNGLDNRIINLREATTSQQRMNSVVPSNNTTGAKGVYIDKRRNNKFYAKIVVDKKSIHLGYFESLNDAIAARKAAEMKYFGEFRRLDNNE